MAKKSRGKTQRGKISVPVILGGLILIFIIVYVVVSGNKPANKSPQSPSDTSTTQLSPLLASEVLALGGTCFTTPFIDDIDDVDVFTKGAKKHIPAPGKSEYDVKQVVIGRDGDNLVVQWDFVGAIPVHANRADNHTNVTLEITQAVANQRDRAVFVAIWNVSDNRWTTIYQAADAWDSTKKDFDPAKRYTYDGDVEMVNNSVRYRIPFALISPSSSVDGLLFSITMFAKQEQAIYNDSISAPKDQPTDFNKPFSCPK